MGVPAPLYDVLWLQPFLKYTLVELGDSVKETTQHD
jgi:hypothetical protein